LCVTDNSSNRVPFPLPESYDPADFELFRRYAALFGPDAVFDLFWRGVKVNGSTPVHAVSPAGPPGGSKWDLNSAMTISFDAFGLTDVFPFGDAATQAAVARAVREHTLGLLYTLANDAALPPAVRAGAREWGLCADDFADSAHFSPLLYVREGRRLLGEAVLVERNVLVDKGGFGNASVGLGSFALDDHGHGRRACAFWNASGPCIMLDPAAPRPPAGVRVGVVQEGCE
jgi:hypothetical protein